MPRLNDLSFRQSFWGRIDATSEADECWPWAGATSKGYGRVWVEGKTHLTNRVAYRLVYGRWPETASHICHNKRCCNPDHLIDESNADNIRRSARDGGLATGERNARHVLTDAVVRIIRGRLAAGESQSAIARDYGVTPPTISKIKSGRLR